MSNWKEKLNENVNQVITSKKSTDYESVVSLFHKKFDELTTKIRDRDQSFARVDVVENTVRFKIHDYDLQLINHKTEIMITKGNEEGSFQQGKIIFENGLSYIMIVEKRYYLCEENIDMLFEEAYKELWS